MTPVLADSCVLLDVLEADPIWGVWSETALAQQLDRARVVINPVIYGEVSAGFSRIETLDEALPEAVFHREPIPFPAAFLAGKAFAAYRRQGGTRRSPLPDFLIGAHAAIAGYAILTRDPTRFRSYFPTVRLIHPEN